MVDLAKNFFALAFRDGLHHLFENVRGRGADQVADRIGGESFVRRGDGLVEDRKRVAHGAVTGFGEQGEGIVVRFDLFAGDEIAQLGRRWHRI